MPKTIGVISDTHGLLRPEAVEALRGSELIIHAGDVGDPRILEQLRQIAPVAGVRGNVDTGRWALALPATLDVDFQGHRIHVRHIRAKTSPDPDRVGHAPQKSAKTLPDPDRVAAVVYGHSHKPSVEQLDGILYLNPGSAGPRRFRLPVTVARMWILDGRLTAQIVDLEIGQRPAPNA